MRKIQWWVLSIASYLLGILFAGISLQWKGYCEMFGEVEMSNIFACVRGEIFAPFPYIFFTFGLVFMMMAWMEKEK
ncbi:unnamed protein product [marine sediment metagenome]|uniref:Vitamin K epoxide reductase domain-containing protein n=1 Tax=marine sediment metagenome TaxID=412755 RepID=X1EJB5_9ZZZZ